MDRTEKSIVLVVLAVLAGCLCISIICGAVIIMGTNLFAGTIPSPLPELAITETKSAEPQETMQVPTLESTPIIYTEPDTLSILSNTDIPIADLVILAEKYFGKKALPLQLSTAPILYEVGDSKDFYKLNVSTNENTRITATLRYATESVYFWAEDGIDLNITQLKTLVDKFTEEIYPINQNFFGKEWLPGVDNDPHLYLLYASKLGNHLAGYTSPVDAVLPAAHEYSNAHEMFVINADVQTLSDPYTFSVLAHELQHLIHGYHDPNEELWLNEGFSELATLLNGYDAGGFDYVFTYNPDVQLNDWSINPSENDAHYGASFLYVTYLLDRFGEGITRNVVAESLNGFSSIDKVFHEHNLFDPISGKLITADDFFADWVITNYLQNASVGDGRFRYSNYTNAPNANSTEVVTACDGTVQERTVKQYGTDYIEINCPIESLQLHFSGSPVVPVLGFANIDGKFMWSNRADSSATSLSREFDLTRASGLITFSYQTWYDLEQDYDYLYLLASENGKDFEIVNTPSCTTSDLSGNSYGCGYNGSNQGWITETVDLSSFAGKKVTLSFEYVTDAAVTGEGLILDNLQIPAIGYSADFESDDGGWTKQGFARIDNSLPQTFIVSLISNFGSTLIQKFMLDSTETLDLQLESLPSGETYILVVSGSTRFTRQEANYQFSVK